jgi:hypothetical protein
MINFSELILIFIVGFILYLAFLEPIILIPSLLILFYEKGIYTFFATILASYVVFNLLYGIFG